MGDDSAACTVQAELEPAAHHAYPLLRSYLAGLPNGFHSYPSCRILGDVGRAVQQRYPSLWSDRALPRGLRHNLTTPWQPGQFLPIVLITCQSMILRDRLNMSEEAYLRDVGDRSLAVLRSPIYRAVLGVLSPNVLLLGVRWRWEKFMQGTELESCGGTRRSHTLRLLAPPNLLTSTWFKFVAATMVAALHAAHGRQATVQWRSVNRQETLFELHWR